MNYAVPRASRRGFLAGAAATALVGSSVFAPRPARAQGSLKVGTYGGYFQDSFNEHIFPVFTEETGIEVDSVAEPTGEAWLVQLETAARAGQAPADVSMMAQVARLRGEKSELWVPLDLEKIPNHQYVQPHFIHRDAGDQVTGIGAVSWYITLVTNTDIYPEAPTSWTEFWNPENEDSIGLLALASNSFLLEITAKTHFGGTDILGSQEGVLEVMAKLQEVKPNVRLWYRDEGQFQQALQSGEIPMGQYYHDVTGLAAAEGFPVRSTFPKEGGVLDSGSWCVTRASDKLEEAHTFINFMCKPEIQALMSRMVGTSPTVQREHLDLTNKEFDAVSSEIPPILPRYELYLEQGDWVNQKWSELITS
ncbi:extracellular solute-binding protein [Rhodospirillaceae bacterium SYSU D60014]|uniref:ABC transporter substrate-binding protein n=1 Tax=Virgifigura deserti TaxID=2268457 RepID=UPI000E665399